MIKYRSVIFSLLLLSAPVATIVFLFGIDRNAPSYSVAAQVFAITLWWLLLLVAIFFYAISGRAFLGTSYWFAVFPPIAFAYLFLHGIDAVNRSGFEVVATCVIALLSYCVLFRQSVTVEVEPLSSNIALEFIQECGFRSTRPRTHFDFLPVHIGVFVLLIAFGAVPSLSH